MTFDLSAITDSLLDMVRDSWDSAPLWAELDPNTSGPHTPTFTPTVSGLAPDELIKESGPQLSLFLYHVEPNNAVESLFWAPQSQSNGGQPVRFLPLALNLYYLMSAFADNYHVEQQAMSVAMRIFHANPIVHGPVNSPPWELSLAMENRPYNEMSDLWQATTVAMRLSVVYRAAVVLIDPDALPAAAQETTGVTVIAEQGTHANPDSTEFFGTFRQASYTAPDGPVPFTQSPATVAAGQQVWLMGANLSGAAISLIAGDGSSTDISAWVVDAGSTATRVVLQVPTTSPPATGSYQVGIGANLAPLNIAAFVDPAGGPVLPNSASITLTGAGFVEGTTEVDVGAQTIPANQLTVAADGTSLTFTTPQDPAGTVVPINVRVQGIASDPTLWVML